jgi:hypothetical protein
MRTAKPLCTVEIPVGSYLGESWDFMYTHILIAAVFRDELNYWRVPIGKRPMTSEEFYAYH